MKLFKKKKIQPVNETSEPSVTPEVPETESAAEVTEEETTSAVTTIEEQNSLVTQIESEDSVVFRVVPKTAAQTGPTVEEETEEPAEIPSENLKPDFAETQPEPVLNEEKSPEEVVQSPEEKQEEEQPDTKKKKKRKKQPENVKHPVSPLSEEERLWLRKPIEDDEKPARKKGWDIVMILLEELLIVVATWVVGTFLPNSGLIIPISALALVINFSRIWFSRQLNKIFDFLYKWRWLIALIVFALCVLCQLHTSNAAAYMYNFQANPGVENSILFGEPRLIRTDEYVVQLPYYWSQFYNNYQEISHQMSVTGQNMIIGYNAPVWDLTMLGKPFVLGYLLFGNNYGMSWYFSAKTILMFMVAIEMFHILTKNRYMAVFGAFVFTFAPGMQWWYSPHFYDVIFWACTLFVVGYWFFMARGWKKWLMSLLAVSSLTGFVLALFPSLQVPLGMLALFMMIACLIRDRDQLQFKWWDLANVAFVIAGLGIVLVPTLWGMRNEIEILMNTAYPGSRISVGGYGESWRLFVNPASIIQSFVDPVISNNSEFSSYTHFGLICMMYYPLLRYGLHKKKDRQAWVGDVLMIAMIIEVTFMFVTFPEWLSKLMLLSYCNRMNTVYGVTATIFTVWTIQMASQTEMPLKKTYTFLIFVIYTYGAYSRTWQMDIPNFNTSVPHGSLVLYILMFGISIAFYLTLTRFKQLGLAGMILWTACSGCLVNPIMVGSASVTDYPIAEKTRQIVEEDPDAWWAYMGSNVRSGLLTANGAKVVNGVSFYPDFDKWELLDPDLMGTDTINRYAHIQISPITTGETEVEVELPDLLTVHMNPYDLEKWDVRYLMTDEDYLPALDAVKLPYDIVYHDKKGQLILELDWD